MECFLLFVALVVGVTVLIALAAVAQSRADKWNKSWQALAQRYGGSCTPAGWFGRPSVRFRYGQAHVLLNTYKLGGAQQYTQLFVNWPDHDLRCEVFSEKTWPRPRALAGVVEFRHGADFFRRGYVVRAGDPREVQALLSESVQWQIEQLRRFLNRDDLYVSIHRGRMMVRKATMIRDTRTLDDFAQLALALFDQAMLTRMVGIEFVDGDAAQIIQEAICQVCGEDIVTDMVFCRRCKTPHHQECWQYYGSCTTYGCGETRWFAPRAAS